MTKTCMDCYHDVQDANEVRCQEHKARFEIKRTYLLKKRVERLLREEFNGSEDLPSVRHSDSTQP